MYEALSDWHGGPPNEDHFSLYRLWAEGGWGIIISGQCMFKFRRLNGFFKYIWIVGNVQVSSKHLSLGRDILVPEELTPDSIKPFKDLAQSMHIPGNSPPLKLMQLAHAGRQSSQFVGGRYFTPPVGASDIPITPPPGWFGRFLFAILFRSPRPLSGEYLHSVFLDVAKIILPI